MHHAAANGRADTVRFLLQHTEQIHAVERVAVTYLLSIQPDLCPGPEHTAALGGAPWACGGSQVLPFGQSFWLFAEREE